MIKLEEFRQIDTNIDEGKLLLAAISILTSIDSDQIKRKRGGGMISPDQAHDQIVELANRIFFEEEFKTEVKRKRKEKRRTRLINKLLQG
jgi:PleD family two-component response regulator